MRILYALSISALAAFGLTGGSLYVQAQAQGALHWRFVGESGASLAGLSSGAVGEGELLYYGAGARLDRPQLVVRLLKRAAGGDAQAEVFQAPGSHAYVPVVLRSHGVDLPAHLHPALTITAIRGWWVRHGLANYNLDISVFGRLPAMWDGPPASSLPTSGKTAQIETRMNGAGTPVWDYRRLVPRLAGSGYVRTNYAQRECAGGPLRLRSPTSLWPYVSGLASPGQDVTAVSGQRQTGPTARTPAGFLQPTDRLRPPILVDWTTGKIVTFAEVVSVRGEACSYDFYSLTPIRPHELNRPDFESPWGLYDLSGRDRGYPNLIVNMAHYPAGDPWLRFAGGSAGAYNQSASALSNVRYSWAVHPGNGSFDYKVDLFGPRDYATTVAIAGGQTRVRAPSYGRYPAWVVDHQWPSATFVDADPPGYASSEGIYPWDSWDVNDPAYWTGSAMKPDSGYDSISVGLRGEYRIGSLGPTALYASPIDGGLHLVGAQGGLWNLGNGWCEQESNLNGGLYIDAWTLERSKAGCREGREVEELVAAGEHLIYISHGGLAIRGLHTPVGGLTIAPPTSRVTWERFVRATRPFRTPRNPLGMSRWVSSPPGRATKLRARIVRWSTATSSGVVNVTLRLTAGSYISGLHVPTGGGWYVVRVPARGPWTIRRASAPAISGRLVVSRPSTAGALASAHLTIANTGQVPWTGTVRWQLGRLPVERSRVALQGGGSAGLTSLGGIHPGTQLNGRVWTGSHESRFLASAPALRRPPNSDLVPLGGTSAGQLAATGVLLAGLVLSLIAASRGVVRGQV